MEYHFCSGTDAGYLPQTAVLIHSIVKATAASERPADGDVLVFHVLGDGLSASDRERLTIFGGTLADVFPSRLVLHDTDSSDFSSFKGWTESESRSTYLRFLIPRFIGSDVKRVLYLDADMICNADLRELFETDLEGHVLGAVCDAISSHAVHKELRIKGRGIFSLGARVRYGQGESYFNAGMLLIDLDCWKESGVSEHCTDILRHYVTPMCDQDALNLFLRVDVKQLSACWNLLWPFTFRETLPLLERSDSMKDPLLKELTMPYALGEKKPALLHFAGFVKPWRRGRFVLDSGYPSPALMAVKRDYLERAVSVPVFGEIFLPLLDECRCADPGETCMQLGHSVASWLAHDRFPAFEKGIRRGLRQRGLIRAIIILQTAEITAIAWLVWLVFNQMA